MIRSIEKGLQRGQKRYVGIDIGSVSVKAALINGDKEVLESHYVRSHGQPVETVLIVLKEIFNRIPVDDIEAIAATGSGGKLLSEIIGISFINEIVAQSTATSVFHPDVRTVIEIGGEDSKLIMLEPDETGGSLKVSDFSMNTMCAAGTGSFLDQQATRIGVSIEEEFGKMALKSKNPPRIAGRCSVFAKSDMIHLQQVGTEIHDVVSGLCYALTRNFKSNIGKGKEFLKPIAFQGGVAANAGIVRAFEDILELREGELVIPKHFNTMGAIGCALALIEKNINSPFKGLKALDTYLKDRKGKETNLKRLSCNNYDINVKSRKLKNGKKAEAYVGVDVGSISTNVVVIDKNRDVLARRYLMTAGKPLEAVRQGLLEVGGEIGRSVIVKGVGVTGSGRYLTGEFIGADIVKNEITAHATAAAYVDKNVDTIFEIGGQDSKYISLENGAIVDFTMNKVCAAGTGSFLEEQSEKLDVSIKQEFGKRALDSCCPSQLGERCTVFMESDLNHHQQLGVPKDDLLAGLSYSIVLNYINRVVEKRKIGDTIFLQGGVAANRGVKAAFEKVTGRTIIVPPHHDVMGAIGSAIIAMEEKTWDESRFKGFDLRGRNYETSSFVCKDCSNVCEIRKVSITGEQPLHYGSRCGKFDDEKKVKKSKNLPRLFNERNKILYGPYYTDRKTKHDAVMSARPSRSRGRIGIPQASTFFELFPMWRTFFTELGLEIVISKNTNRSIINRGIEYVNAETCFPIKVSHGHVIDMLDKDIDYLFLPSVINMTHASPKLTHSYACPYIQCLPYIIGSAVDLDSQKFKVLQPVIHFEYGDEYVVNTFRQIARDVGRRGSKVDHAIKKAQETQKDFYRRIEERGKEVLDNLGEDEMALIIISRPYNGCDSGVNLDLPDKLRDMGILAIPMDCIPLDLEDISRDYPNMYWKYGQKILAAARFIARDKRLYALYITNFGCGPDSFISKFFPREVGGKPFLMIDIDEHSADAGIMTRCEAFLDSLKNARNKIFQKETNGKRKYSLNKQRTMYIPYMNDCCYMAAAAMRANGVKAEALPMPDKTSLELGRKYTSGKECYPAILTTGDIVKKTQSPDFDPDRSVFFMATASGPCRFGQYNSMHRMVLDDIGLPHVPLYTLDQGDDYQEDTSRLGASFRKLTWEGVVFVDYMQKLLHEIRPYEVYKGDSDVIYKQHLRKAEHAIEYGYDLLQVAKEARDSLCRVKVDRSIHKPKIGIIGETYVRGNQYSNNFIIRRIEKLGGKAVVPPFSEWLEYIAHVRREDCMRERDLNGLSIELLTGAIQRYHEHRMSRPFKKSGVRLFKESSIKELIAKGKSYIHDSYRGDPVLSMGRAVEYIEDDYDGIINVIPFHCMPGTAVNAVLEKLQRNHHEIPLLKLTFDGQEETNEETRLEAFMHQAYQRMESRQKSREPDVLSF